MSYLMQRNNLYHYTTKNATEELQNIKVNDFHYLVEDKLHVNSSVASPRTFMFRDVFALCDQHGAVKEFDTQNIKNNEQWPTLLGSMCSVPKFEYKRLCTDKKSVMGTFYRTGYTLHRSRRNQMTVSFILEMDAGGKYLVQKKANSVEVIQQNVLEVLFDFYNMNTFLTRWVSANHVPKYEALLHHPHLQFDAAGQCHGGEIAKEPAE